MIPAVAKLPMVILKNVFIIVYKLQRMFLLLRWCMLFEKFFVSHLHMQVDQVCNKTNFFQGPIDLVFAIH